MKKKIWTLAGTTNAAKLGAVISSLGIKVNLGELAKTINAHATIKQFEGKRVKLVFQVGLNGIEFRVTTPITIDLVREKLNDNKEITLDDIYKIAELKRPDFNTNKIESIVSSIKATIKSAGIKII